MTIYYVGEILETNGEYEYNTHYYFKLDASKNPRKFLRSVAAKWYGDKSEFDAEQQAYTFRGEAWVWAGNIKPISETTYNELHNF